MDPLNAFLNLLAKTEGRDKALRLVQYATLYSVDDKIKGSSFKVHANMRMVRKLLRFLRSLEYSTKIREEFPKLKVIMALNFPTFFKYLTSILQNLFTVLFYLSDHRVFLSEIGVIQKQHAVTHYPRSMKFYFLQNLFGVLNNLVKMSLEVLKNQSDAYENIKKFAFDLIKCLLDCLVALYYLNGGLGAKKTGIVGVITSIMGIIQSLGFM